MKHTKKMALSLTASLMLISQPAMAESIDSLKDNKDKLQEQYKDVTSERDNYDAELKVINKDIQKIESKLIALQTTIRETKNLIDKKESEITETEKKIQVTKRNLEIMKEDLEHKKEKLRENAVFMYSRGEVGFMEFIFRSDSISEFLYRYDFMNGVMDEGESLYDEVKRKAEAIKKEEEKLENQKDSLESQKNELNSELKKHKDAEAESNALKEKLETKHDHVEEEMSDAQTALNGLYSQIAAAEKKIQSEQKRIAEQKRIEEQKRQEAEKKEENSNSNSGNSSSHNDSSDRGSSSSYSSSSLSVPLRSYYISSTYGYRTHPVTGGRKLHNGTDFAAPYGTPIYSVGNGTVLLSGPASGYGNWIVVKNDNGTYAIYGHMYSNQLYVGAGERVSKGQKIAAVGSAGTSTGNHLHFSLATSFNGHSFTYTNPANYINY